MSKETMAPALGGQESADRESADRESADRSPGGDGEESIGMKLIAELDELRLETRHLRKLALQWELALQKANHENDELRAKVSYWRGQAMNPPGVRPLGDKSPLTLTDRGDAADGYGVDR